MRDQNTVRAMIDPNTAAGKVLAVLDAFSADQPDFTLTELAERSGVSKPTTYRILMALEAWRGVRRSPTSGRYRLGMKFFELGGLVPERQRLREVALPYMEDLLTATKAVIHLSQLDGRDALVLERIVGHETVPAPSRVGGRAPATCTAAGKAILAFSPVDVVKEVISGGLRAMTAYSFTNPVLFVEALEGIRRTGVAYDREELRIGLICVGAPIFDHAGRVVAALSISGQVHRIAIESLAPAVRASAMAVSRGLGYDPHRLESQTGSRAAGGVRPTIL